MVCERLRIALQLGLQIAGLLLKPQGPVCLGGEGLPGGTAHDALALAVLLGQPGLECRELRGAAPLCVARAAGVRVRSGGKNCVPPV